ncbi:DNA-directed RNA polymerase III, subunit Rpc [Trema orientale]|uniref:DNA-directed RNA polymerase III, subunit Rpc n=1 Tax=Trema orientale TaxID=63057 RepID=A0A2P5EPJ5_TREOI|nr:DNA-directed RNA polymerase III, subunit Rpc [Trema orientale]
MAYRGRGRGRGYGGGGSNIGPVKQDPFVLFPEDVVLPAIKGVTVEKDLVRRSMILQNYWKSSPYYLEETVSKKGQSTEIERFSDRKKVNNTIMRDSLSQILDHKKFPLELTEGSKAWRQPSRKRVRWNPDSELQKLEIFEKLEQRQALNDKGEKENKEGENEDEDEDQEDRDSEEEPSDDDYIQNKDFDDDDDDFNMIDDGEDDAVY